jgi:hypothetical protein
MTRRMRAVVSGSFRRHLATIQETVEALTEAGVEVLSPADPRVVDEFGEFLFVASDRLRSIRAVQSRHLTSIKSADFVWLVDPDGYVGQSASMEIGFAIACGTPILTQSAPNDLTLRQYVSTVSSITDALRSLAERGGSRADSPTLIVDPPHVATQLHLAIDQLERRLTGPPGHASEREIVDGFRAARSLLDLP